MTICSPRCLVGFLTVTSLAIATLACSAGESKSVAASTPNVTPNQDLRDFIARRQQCDHFRGEEASTPKRQAELDAKLKEFCTGTDAQLSALKKKYRDDKAASKTLADFDANIE